MENINPIYLSNRHLRTVKELLKHIQFSASFISQVTLFSPLALAREGRGVESQEHPTDCEGGSSCLALDLISKRH